MAASEFSKKFATHLFGDAYRLALESADEKQSGAKWSLLAVAGGLDRELAPVRECLEALRWQVEENEPCWCRVRINGLHDEACQRARDVWESIQVKE